MNTSLTARRSEKDRGESLEEARRRDELLPKSERLLKRGEFLTVQRFGQRLYTDSFVVFSKRTGRKTSRLGITASRKVGTAVKRNRLKRVVREVYRRNKHLIPGTRDLVFVLKKHVLDIGYDETLQEFKKLCRRMAQEGRRGPRRRGRRPSGRS